MILYLTYYKSEDKNIKYLTELIHFNQIRVFVSNKPYENMLSIYDLLSTMNVLSKNKIRLGDKNDGGYVLIEPEK